MAVPSAFGDGGSRRGSFCSALCPGQRGVWNCGTRHEGDKNPSTSNMINIDIMLAVKYTQRTQNKQRRKTKVANNELHMRMKRLSAVLSDCNPLRTCCRR